MRRRLLIAAVTGSLLALAGVGAVIALVGVTSARPHRAPEATLHQALVRQLRILDTVAHRRAPRHAPTILIPPEQSCAINARACSLKPCVEFAGSAQASGVATAAPAVDELVTPQLVSPGRPTHPLRPSRPDCRAAPAAGQQRLVPVSLSR